MAPTGNQRGKRMWPSLPTANHIADVANWFFIGSLVVGVVSTILIVWMAGVKETYWEKDRSDSSERIATLNNNTARLQADNLALERILTPRHWLGPSGRGSPTPDGLWKLAEVWSAVAKFTKTVALVQVVPDFESQRLASDVMYGLSALGWNPQFIGTDKSAILPLSIPEGVQIWVDKKSGPTEAAKALAEAMYFEDIRSDRPERNLYRDDPSEQWLPDGDIRKSPPPDTVVILIGMRPALMELWQKQSDRERAAAGTVAK